MIGKLLNLLVIILFLLPAAYASYPILTLPVGQFKDFAFAKDTKSLLQNYPKYKELFGNSSMPYKVPKIVSTGDGYARVMNDFDKLRTDILERKKAAKDNDLNIEQYDMKGGDFAVIAHNLIRRGKPITMLRVFSPFLYEPKACKIVELKCPEGQLEKYKPLLGAMLESRSMDWKNYRQSTKSKTKH